MRLAALALALLPLAARADDVVVFGDSWAEGAADELAWALADRGLSDLTVDGRGVGGTTAQHWADEDPTALAAAVSANPDTRWVWLSIGGNDLFWHHANGVGGQTAADNDAHIRKMLDDLFAVHADVRVVMFGYDFLNFEQSVDCVLQAFLVFGNTITTQGVNQFFLDEVGAVQRAVALDYPQVTYVPSVWGTLQGAEDVPNAPNVALPSPAKYFADCIHPNTEGYRLVLGALVDAYWADPESAAWDDPSDPGEPDTSDPGDTGTADPTDTDTAGPGDTDSPGPTADSCGCATPARPSPMALMAAVGWLVARTRRTRRQDPRIHHHISVGPGRAAIR